MQTAVVAVVASQSTCWQATFVPSREFDIKLCAIPHIRAEHKLISANLPGYLDTLRFFHLSTLVSIAWILVLVLHWTIRWVPFFLALSSPLCMPPLTSVESYSADTHTTPQFVWHYVYPMLRLLSAIHSRGKDFEICGMSRLLTFVVALLKGFPPGVDIVVSSWEFGRDSSLTFTGRLLDTVHLVFVIHPCYQLVVHCIVVSRQYRDSYADRYMVNNFANPAILLDTEIPWYGEYNYDLNSDADGVKL